MGSDFAGKGGAGAGNGGGNDIMTQFMSTVMTKGGFHTGMVNNL